MSRRLLLVPIYAALGVVSFLVMQAANPAGLAPLHRLFFGY